VLRLPLGVVEVAFSPLPGLTLFSGLRNIGKGLVAPFKLVESVLVLPYNVLDGCSRAAMGLGT
jgi:hypothetical protein